MKSGAEVKVQPLLTEKYSVECIIDGIMDQKIRKKGEGWVFGRVKKWNILNYQFQLNLVRLSYIQSMIRKGLSPITRTFFSKKGKESAVITPTQVTTKSKNKGYLPKTIIEANKNKSKLLPPSKDPSKLTVVMEMDEVLAYTFTPDEEGYMMSPRRKEDFHLWFEDFECLLNVYKRKNLDNFLNYLEEECEPVIFSTGVKSYVDLVMSLIDPTRKIKHILTQEHCDRIVEEENDIDEFVKDLQLLGRDMSRVVYLDCKPMAFWLYPENGLCWQEFRADNAMKFQNLDEILIEVEYCRKRKDAREYLREEYNLRRDFQDADLL